MMNRIFRNACMSLLLCGIAGAGYSQGVSLSTNAAAPNANAMLDLNVAGFTAKRGLLIPRMTATQRIAIGSPADGLWVFQTDNVAGAASGLWYYDNTASSWVRFATGDGWKIAGDVGNAAYYAGTADATDFNLGTNNTDRVTFTTGGNMGIGTATPAEKLELDGALHLDPSGAMNISNDEGSIRWNGTINEHQGNVTGTAAGWLELGNAFQEVTNAPYQGTTLTCGPGNRIETGVGNSQSSGNVDTPFPSAVGRGWKVQYIFTAAELTGFGLCPGYITQVAFRVVTDDTQATSYNLRCGLKHTTRNDFGAATPFWDDGVGTQATINSLVASSGWFTFNLNGAGWLWNGTDAIIVQVSAQRAPTVGNSPPVVLRASVAGPLAPRTRIGYHPGSTAGWLFDDNPTLNPTGLGSAAQNSVLTSIASRPIIRFTGEALGPVPITSNDDYALYEGGLSVGTAGWASGVFKGPGIIQAQDAVYDGSVQLSDHVFDHYYDGEVRDEDIPRLSEYEWKDLAELRAYMAENRHLPNMPSRAEWEANGSKSLGEISTGLWQTIEQQALYIAELEEDLRILEELAYKQGMNDAEFDALLNKVNNNPRLDEEQKKNITETLRDKHAQHSGKAQK